MYMNDSKPLVHDEGISVPIMWNNELTPYFHLDLAAAVSAATDSLSPLQEPSAA